LPETKPDAVLASFLPAYATVPNEIAMSSCPPLVRGHE